MDRVLTVEAYYDGALLGIAEFEGVPHIYQNGYMYGIDDDEASYYLSPLAPELLALAMEQWAIWRRYLAASGTPQADHAAHPALACDRERYEAIVLAIGDRLKTDPQNRIRVRGEFWSAASPPDAHALWDGLRVRWTRCEAVDAVEKPAPL